jgi:hypothetical protein
LTPTKRTTIFELQTTIFELQTKIFELQFVMDKSPKNHIFDTYKKEVQYLNYKLQYLN